MSIVASTVITGSTQRTRALPHLDPTCVPIDERDELDRLAFAGQYARLLAFYDLTGQPAGDWSPFVRHTSFLLAEIGLDTRTEYFAAVALGRRLRQTRDSPELEREMVRRICHQAVRIDDWYRRAAPAGPQPQGADRLQEMLSTVIKDDLSKYRSAVIEDPVWRGYWQECKPPEFSPCWNDASEKIPADEARVERLITIFGAFNRATRTLAHRAREQLEGELRAATPTVGSESSGQGSYPPHVALFVSFAKLMEPVRSDLNRFTERHLDYYFRRVLGLGERPGDTDRAHVYFTLAPHVDELTLAAGTRLQAGKDSAGNVLFATEHALTISAARVAALKTIAVSRVSASGAVPGHVSRIVALPVADSEDGRGKPLSHPESGWPTFGGAVPTGNLTAPQTLDAEVGLVIASPLLLLAAGHRTVTLTFECAATPQSGVPFASTLQQYADAVKQRATDSGSSKSPPTSGTLPGDTCQLYVSTAGGWLARAFELTSNAEAATIELQFVLLTSDPPLLRPEKAALVDGIDSPWPLLKIRLNPAATVYAYTFYQQLSLAELHLSVRVVGLSDLVLRGSAGPIKSGQPFPVFGALPVLGSSLRIEHPELDIKPLDQVSLTIDWLGLPASLAAYYEAYDRGIDATTFQGTLSLHSNGTALERRFALLAQGSRLSVPLDLQRDGQPIDSAQDSTPGSVPAGVLQLQLSAPEFAFGQVLYPRVVTQAALERSSAALQAVMHPRQHEMSLLERLRHFIRHLLHRPEPPTSDQPASPRANAVAVAQMASVPNPPLVPWAKSLSIDYVASTRLRTDGQLPAGASGEPRIELFDVHPFGHRRRNAQQRALFPVYSDDGYLYIGLATLVPPARITLLFDLEETAAFQRLIAHDPDLDRTLPALQWRYLVDDEWREFPVGPVVQDSTRKLTCSGIMTLRIPADASLVNSVMPDRLVWIQVSAPKYAACYPNVVGIYPHAVTATRLTPMPSDTSAGASLPAGTITELVDKMAAVKSVQQPMPTVEGSARESVERFRIRVAERLRHKQRAIQPFDYERLILDRFPSVGQACCLTWNSTQRYAAAAVTPGSVVIAVAPIANEAPLPLEPRVPYSTLSAIREYLQGLTSPAVSNIRVVNPLYERVALRAEVHFAADREVAPLLQLEADLATYLAPWRGRPDAPMSIGTGLGSVQSLHDFIENLDYIEHVRLESVAVMHDDGSATMLTADSDLQGSKPWSVLVPADDPHTMIRVVDRMAAPAPTDRSGPALAQSQTQAQTQHSPRHFFW